MLMMVQSHAGQPMLIYGALQADALMSGLFAVRRRTRVGGVHQLWEVPSPNTPLWGTADLAHSHFHPVRMHLCQQKSSPTSRCVSFRLVLQLSLTALLRRRYRAKDCSAHSGDARDRKASHRS